MIIINLHGGLGNQLFQYSFGLRLSKSYQGTFVLNTAYLPKDGYRLKYLGIKSNTFNYGKNYIYYLCNFRTYFNIKTSRLFNIYFDNKRIIDSLPPKIRFTHNVFDGYWQGFCFVDHVLDSVVSTINKSLSKSVSPYCLDLYEKINNHSNSVMVHIRRGDYLTKPKANKLYTHLDLQYYLRAFDYLQSRYTNLFFFIFSNDPNWCSEQFDFLDNKMILKDNLSDYETIFLMKSCKHDIISNSTFSWWASQINTNSTKTIIAPKQWFTNEEMNSHSLYKEDWILF